VRAAYIAASVRLRRARHVVELKRKPPKIIMAAKGPNLRRVSSDAHDPIELLSHACELGWRDPVRVHPGELSSVAPGGDCASLSDTDENLVVEELPEQ